MAVFRTIVGVIISIIGFVLILYAALNFDSLFFVRKMLTEADIPGYGRSVAVPAFLGLLILLDGSFVLGLKRIFSLSVHLLGNFLWLLALYQFNQNLLGATTDISAYQQAFHLVLAGMVFFIGGIIVNDIPQRKK
jgi:hypothetical protein